MKNYLSVLTFLFFSAPLWAQGLGEATYTLSPRPWNGDWLQERLNQMVGGEDFHGFPGPLPKMWYALGLDPNHPSVSFELRERVKRDSPFWFGSCNGWAAAATQFSEPDPMVINGVKLFSSEVKAILASIWKDNVENKQGDYDAEGITAKSFEEILYQYIAQGNPIIFDVTLGLESWNYPVVGFTRNAVQNGDWVDVEVLVRYANAVPLALLDQEFGDSLAYLDKTYTYRYNDEGIYQWVGTSLVDRPQRAWYTDVPFLRTWYVRGNRHLNMGVFDTLTAKAQEEAAMADRYEPNDAFDAAYDVSANLMMGSLPEGDRDFFRFTKAAGESSALQFRVYDGPDVDVYLRDGVGNVLESFLGVCEAALSPGLGYDGDYVVEIVATDEAVFYDLQQAEDRGYVVFGQDAPYIGGVLTAVNVHDTPAQLVEDNVVNVPGKGSVEVPMVMPDVTYRSDQATVWAAEGVADGRLWKRYIDGHVLELNYVVPHLTCRNGWKTELTLHRTTDAPVTITVYGLDGGLIERRVLPENVQMDLGSVLTNGAAAQGTWFRLDTTQENTLHGFVTYRHDGIGYRADFDIDGRPRNGEMVVTNLPRAGAGWVGLALVNTSGVLNPITYRLRDGRGTILTEGDFDLEPGEKWLGLPGNLSDLEIGEEYTLWFFSQFNVETLALRHDTVHTVDYAHRLPNPILDMPTETYVTLSPIGLDTQAFHITNPGIGANYVTFRGINAAGEEVLFHRLNGQPFFDFDQRYFTMLDLFADAGLDPDNHDIAHFKVTSSKPIIFSELVGFGDTLAKRHVAPVSIFEKP